MDEVSGGGVIGAQTRIDGAFVPAHAPGVVAVDADGEAVLVDEGARELHLLNASAALLWRCFDGTSTATEIGSDLADTLGVPFATILDDLLGVVEGLVERGLLWDGRGDAPVRPEPADQSADVPRPDRLLEEPPNG